MPRIKRFNCKQFSENQFIKKVCSATRSESVNNNTSSSNEVSYIADNSSEDSKPSTSADTKHLTTEAPAEYWKRQ